MKIPFDHLFLQLSNYFAVDLVCKLVSYKEMKLGFQKLHNHYLILFKRKNIISYDAPYVSIHLLRYCFSVHPSTTSRENMKFYSVRPYIFARGTYDVRLNMYGLANSFLFGLGTQLFSFRFLSAYLLLVSTDVFYSFSP